MHLEILYKSVNFIKEEKILAGLAEYKAKKERLRLEEEQRQHDTKSKKKHRARSLKEEPSSSNRQNGSLSHEETANNDKQSKKEEVHPQKTKHHQFTPTKKITRSSGKREDLAHQGESPAIFKSQKQDKRMEEEDLDVTVSIDDSSSNRSGASRNSRYSYASKGSGLSKALRKIRKQKKQSKLIEKIFLS